MLKRRLVRVPLAMAGSFIGTCALLLIGAAAPDTIFEPVPGSDQCCVPAHAEAPTPPPGGNASCTRPPTKPGVPTQPCSNTGGVCQGDSYQSFIEGYCATKKGKNCTPPPDSGASTPIESSKGTWYCPDLTAPHPAGGIYICECQLWLYDPPQTVMQVVADCTGDGC